MRNDNEMVRRAFRLVVQRGVIFAGFVDVFQALLFTLQGVGSGWGRNDTLSHCPRWPEIFAGQNYVCPTQR